MMNMGGPRNGPIPPILRVNRARGSIAPCHTLIWQPLDPDEDQPIIDGPDGQAHAVAHASAAGVKERRVGVDGHQLHGFHAQRGDGIVPDQDQSGGRPGDELAAHFVRGRTQDRAPDADGEGDEQGGEERGQDQPAAPERRSSIYLCPACGSGSSSSAREG